MSETVYLGLGSNLGDREGNLVRAVEALGRIDAVAVLGRSALYDSAPVGPTQPRYLNAAVELECGLPPQRLLTILKEIEAELGRQGGGPRWGPRVADLDILLWDGRLVADPNLQVPHLGLHQRRFVLEPLCDLCPQRMHPVLQVSLATLRRKVASQDVVRFESTHWPLAARELLEQHG